MAALPPAGVSLQAQGFKEYVRNLDIIEKKQREAFEAEFKGTGKSFEEVTKAAKAYEKQLADTARAEKQAAAEAERLARAQVKASEETRKAQVKAAQETRKAQVKAAEDAAKAEQRAAKDAEKAAQARIKAAKREAQEQKKLIEIQRAARAARQQAFISAGTVALDFAQKLGTVVIESGKLAAQFEGQQTGLQNLAASFGQSGSAIQRSIQAASKGTLSGLDAIQAANQGLLLGVAQTPEEFANLTNSALTLGRTLGLTGTQAIEQFTSALGRQSLLILDNFGISASQVNNEIERLARADFGKARAELTEAQKQATFMKAALNIAGQAAATIGEEAGNAQAAFDRLSAASEDLQVTFGTLIGPLGTGIANALSQAAKTAQQFFAFLGAGFTGIGTIATGVFNELGIAVSRLGQLIKGEISFAEFRQPLREFSDILDEAGLNATERFKEIASTIDGISFDEETLAQPFEAQSDAIEEATQSLEGYQSALQQAENLQLSFGRAAEDAAIKLARANEDIARKQAKTVADLQERQAKDRDKLLKNQQKQLDRFEKNREKQIAKAEGDIAKARKEAADKRKEDQRKLQRELARAQERFNLSQLQSERRFALSERRLRAEGDILAIQQLREDRDLERQEEKENFAQGQKDRVQSAGEQQREQAKDLQSRVSELKSSLEDQRAELLKSFDEQFVAQQQAQVEARAQQQARFAEEAAERQIALQREEEDRRLSQQRQLEDLGRSLADQQGVTEEGVNAIAGELEKVFGQEGVADTIFGGFKERTESDFRGLFENLEGIVSDVNIPEPSRGPVGLPPPLRRTPAGIPAFQDGGVVGGPGPVGSPQIIQAHKGETMLPTHQRSFTMAAPVIPSQRLDVAMSGGFNITGNGQADEAILQAATAEMTETIRIAVRRIARRN